uniref:Uncharacterized protein n=1 Tax=Polynucleobacter necessarius subsp. necessarius (strain STIR1) TaxID=452638 RepID=B1XVX3_POLNS
MQERILECDQTSGGWSLVAGVLIILAACIFSYMLTKPAEADVAILFGSYAAHAA